MNPLLHFGGRRRTPVLLQTEAAECGLACLAMVAAHHGRGVDLPTLRAADGAQPRGANLLQLSRAATLAGLVGRPLKVELDALPRLKLPAVLHWDFNHFVVLVRCRRGRALIHDPAAGARDMALAELSQHFTGVCLELTPAADFKPARPVPRVSVLDLLGGLRGAQGASARGALLQILAMAAALELLAVMAPLLMQLVVDQALVSADRALLTVLGLGFLLLALVHVAITAARAWVVMVLGAGLNLQVLLQLFSHLLKLPLSYFERRHLGDIGSRFDSIAAIQRTLTTSFVEALVDGVMVLLTLAMMLVYAPVLAGVVVAAALAYGAVRLLLNRALRDAQTAQITHLARQQSSFFETVRGIQSVKLFGRQQQRCTLYANLLADNVNAGIRMQQLGIAAHAANGVLFGVENIVVICWGAALVLDGALSVGMLFAFIAFKQQFVTRVAGLVDKGVEFRMLGLHAERASDVALCAAEPGHDRPDTVPQNATVELRDVRFRYAKDDPPILDGFNMRIADGESVAIVGPSGCGKSTLLKLVLGLLEPEHGQVLIGGIDIARTGLGWRDLLGTVMQDDELFAGSIADNICFFDVDRDVERIEACARRAAIDADIQAMPMRYHTPVGDMGSTLSGGQKQRILLARALYKQPRILVLDEATSHLDMAHERSVSDAVRALSLTRLIVAHRAETISSADRVVTLASPAAVERLRRVVAV